MKGESGQREEPRLNMVNRINRTMRRQSGRESKRGATDQVRQLKRYNKNNKTKEETTIATGLHCISQSRLARDKQGPRAQNLRWCSPESYNRGLEPEVKSLLMVLPLHTSLQSDKNIAVSTESSPGLDIRSQERLRIVQNLFEELNANLGV